MRIFPIIPLWLMIIIGVLLLIVCWWKVKQKKIFLQSLLIIILLFLTNLRIMIPSKGAVTVTNNLDVLFVIDNTISMLAEDYQSNKPRLEGVKKDCEYIIEELAGARFSVITFSNNSNIMIPYTKDVNMVKEAIDIIRPVDELFAKGTNLDIPIQDIEKSLKSSKEKKNNIRIVFYISDGEINSNEERKSFQSLKSQIDNGAILGYGTTTGGYMKVFDKYTEQEKYLEDRSDYPYQKAISKIDEKNLKEIASELGIQYFNMSSNQNNLKDKLNEIKKMSKDTFDKNDLSSYNDIYYLFVIPLLVIFVIIYRDMKHY